MEETSEIVLRNSISRRKSGTQVPNFCPHCAPISGAMAGAVGIIIGQPFDTLKVLGRHILESEDFVFPCPYASKANHPFVAVTPIQALPP